MHAYNSLPRLNFYITRLCGRRPSMWVVLWRPVAHWNCQEGLPGHQVTTTCVIMAKGRRFLCATLKTRTLFKDTCLSIH